MQKRIQIGVLGHGPNERGRDRKLATGPRPYAFPVGLKCAVNSLILLRSTPTSFLDRYSQLNVVPTSLCSKPLSSEKERIVCVTGQNCLFSETQSKLLNQLTSCRTEIFKNGESLVKNGECPGSRASKTCEQLFLNNQIDLITQTALLLVRKIDSIRLVGIQQDSKF